MKHIMQWTALTELQVVGIKQLSTTLSWSTSVQTVLNKTMGCGIFPLEEGNKKNAY